MTETRPAYSHSNGLYYAHYVTGASQSVSGFYSYPICPKLEEDDKPACEPGSPASAAEVLWQAAFCSVNAEQAYDIVEMLSLGHISYKNKVHNIFIYTPMKLLGRKLCEETARKAVDPERPASPYFNIYDLPKSISYNMLIKWAYYEVRDPLLNYFGLVRSGTFDALYRGVFKGAAHGAKPDILAAFNGEVEITYTDLPSVKEQVVHIASGIFIGLTLQFSYLGAMRLLPNYEDTMKMRMVKSTVLRVMGVALEMVWAQWEAYGSDAGAVPAVATIERGNYNNCIGHASDEVCSELFAHDEHA
jgi:hypothetical protein